MKRYCYTSVIIALFILVTISSCNNKNDNPTPPAVTPKVGLISGVGGFDDRGFNHLALLGLQRADNDLNVYAESRESLDTAQIRENINYFVQNGFNLIITLGFDAADPTLKAASANPSIKFALLDCALASTPSNMICFAYRVDQSAFLCGFLGAYWSQLNNPAAPMAGWIGGPDIPEIEHFKAGYTKGIDYFNTFYGKSVLYNGFFATGFNDTLQGANLADSLIRLGANVIFPFAGKTGNGALYKIKEQNLWGIGVDIDQYVTIPDVSGRLLTSCLKKLDNTVYNVINYFSSSGFGSKKIYYGTLATVDVDIAPFHDYNQQIPDSIKNELTTIRSGIIDGTINTGWIP
jgi:basic membrane protein A and related proteins